MSSIFNLNKDNAPLVHSIKEAIPFQGLIFDYNITKKPENGSTAVHIIRSGITIATYSSFIIAALFEKAIRYTLDMIQKGIDKALSKDQQKEIKDKTDKYADKAKNYVKEFFKSNFNPFFRTAS